MIFTLESGTANAVLVELSYTRQLKVLTCFNTRFTHIQIIAWGVTNGCLRYVFSTWEKTA